eukprot:NODE_113_length_3103_cov_31.933132_g106_i0.p1 GENE.NODE_113_length_3103_cov_31.933132_g106_i0~~NODE_113_length_3103_cov_31.933132_g106_i0.p1  ORF type:complete len:982 (-),score=356.67 NODE_113_length_3103_cov_31.933132_g106_i0:158-3046(-)
MNVQTIATTLENSFAADKNVRKQAEEQLKQMRSQAQFAQQLLHVVLAEGLGDGIRQSAAIYFKNLARYHWDPREDFHLNDSDKQEVKGVVVNCMVSCPSSQIRTILSDAIAKICEIDFPAQWPGVVQDLVSKFTSTQDLTAIAGSLYTAHSIFKRYRTKMELTESLKQEILCIVQQFGPPMLELLERTVAAVPAQSGNKQGLMALFQVLNLLIDLYHDLNCLDMADWFLTNLTRFMTSFITCIGFNFPILIDADEEDHPGILDQNKSLILDCITLCLERFDEDFQPYVEKFTTAVWDLLLNITPMPKHDQICISALGFLTGVSRTIYHSLLSAPERQKLVCEKIIIPNMELRPSDLEMFEDDPAEYIRRDIEGSDSDTRRRSSCDLIQGLSRNYEQTITTIFQQYVQYLTTQYTSSPDNWKAKDTSMYLITALTVRGATTQRGTSKINELVNIGEFFASSVLPELRDTSAKFPILKADAIRFVSSFRLQIPKTEYLPLLSLLANWLKSPNEVVHSYAAAAIERLLMVKDPTTQQVRLGKEEWKDLAGLLLEGLFQTLQTSKQENEYIMKAIMRVILSGQENVAPFVPHILPTLVSVLAQVARNPQHPTFNHYLFESISGLVKYNPGQLLEQTIFPIFTNILQSDTSEFMPYVFQIFAQMLEQHQEVNAVYMGLFPPLLSPTLFENKGNIPALVKLIKVFMQKGSAQILASHQLTAVLGVFQFLVSSRLYDHEGFNLLNTIIAHFPRESLAEPLTTVLNILLTRLMSSRTTKFVRCLLVFFSLVCVKLGPDTLVESVEKLQAGGGLWRQVYSNVWLRDVQKVSGKIPRKVCIIALAKLTTESKHMLETHFETWAQSIVALLKMIELGEEQDAEHPDQYANKHVITVDQLKEQEQGYMNAYCPLSATAKAEEDPCQDIPDERLYFTQALQKLMSSPHAQKCAQALKQLPVEVQGRLKPILPGMI